MRRARAIEEEEIERLAIPRYRILLNDARSGRTHFVEAEVHAWQPRSTCERLLQAVDPFEVVVPGDNRCGRILCPETRGQSGAEFRYSSGFRFVQQTAQQALFVRLHFELLEVDHVKKGVASTVTNGPRLYFSIFHCDSVLRPSTRAHCRRSQTSGECFRISVMFSRPR